MPLQAPHRFDRSGERLVLKVMTVGMVFCLLGCGKSSDSLPNTNGATDGGVRLKPEVVEVEPVTTTGDEKDVVSNQRQSGNDSPAAPVEPLDVVTPKPKLRRRDDRPVHDDEALAAVGIHRYAARRFVLYTDIDPEVARTLPPLIDAVYEAWIDYFGPLPEAEDGSDFQITGYIIRDRRPFLEMNLLPEELVTFQHGQHRGYRFWMWEQKFDYYRRHLLLHEATHCFMLIQDAQTRPPLWYLEGMAERFGCHATDAEGNVRFRVMPDQHENFVGFGRIEMIHEAIDAGDVLTIDEVHLITANEFAVDRRTPYAWSWALCTLLDTHPRYRDRFRELARVVDGGEFLAKLHDLFQPDLPLLHADWELLVHTLSYGHNIEAAAVDYRRGELLPPEGSLGVRIAANRGWQNSGITVKRGESYHVSATGEVSLAELPQPWTSEPQGISIRYSGGRPIGRLLAAIQSDGPPDATGVGRLMKEIDIGRASVLTAPIDGTLYFRVNDLWGELADNRGSTTSPSKRNRPGSNDLICWTVHQIRSSKEGVYVHLKGR
ncbi:MAG: hypothetical protein R3C01_14685 [Planctomycetaceae bacterium]